MKTELSAREMEIAKLFALGHSGAEIGRILNRSDKTVQAHKARIRNKLSITTNVGWMTFLRGLPSEEPS